MDDSWKGSCPFWDAWTSGHSRIAGWIFKNLGSRITIHRSFFFSKLWVNLKKEFKMVEPAYQELLAKDIPLGEKDGVKVKGKAIGRLWKNDLDHIDLGFSDRRRIHGHKITGQDTDTDVLLGLWVVSRIFSCPSNSIRLDHFCLHLGRNNKIWR